MDDTTRAKISKALSNKPRLNRRIGYKIENKIFFGLEEGAEYFNVTKSSISLWIKKGYTSRGLPIEVLVDNQLYRIH